MSIFKYFLNFRYAAILFKKQRYVSDQRRMNIKIEYKDKFKCEVQEKAVNAVSVQQLAEEYWRIDKFFLISFPILFFVFMYYSFFCENEMTIVRKKLRK